MCSDILRQFRPWIGIELADLRSALFYTGVQEKSALESWRPRSDPEEPQALSPSLPVFRDVEP
ncbi:hypothetical protein D779_3070 [Imhoffiella purpurea]|uniref:Uncharacterized protein n=1 Tax=Imhoffiella purpurea TaxID=1249627 RepID=W9VUG5_9GAMM|nr:hypothetical protein D779_3070 [Imhoffiella purpurea]